MSWADVSDSDLERILASSLVESPTRDRALAEVNRRTGVPVDVLVGPQKNGKNGPSPRPKMTQVEQRYAAVLEMRKRNGDIRDFWFEAMAFRVGAGRSVYKPDFVARLPDGTLEIIEVKGARIWEDSKVKFKAAAVMYPCFTWRMLQWVDGEWKTLYDFERAE